jgi:hypothetical protein
MVLVPSALTSICVVLPVTSALMVPLPLSYNRFATDCVKEVISAAVPLVNLNVNGKYRINVVAHGSEMTAIGAKQLATHITDLQTKLVVLPVTSALMVPLPLSYNRFATDCVKEVISAAVPLEEGLSVSQPTKAIRPCSV